MKKGSGMRQLLAVLLAVWMAAAGALGVAAQEEKKQVAMSFTARSALLMEQQTGKVLFSQNETQRMAPASLTKLMDLLLIFQQLQSGKLTMEQELTCSAYAKTMGGSEIWLKEGERMTVEELLKALVVASANDAAVVFAEAIASSEEEFVRLMNEKAQQLGLQNTHFVNCTGFDEEGHYTCAQDVAVLARELMTGYGEQLTRFSTIWMDSLRSGETQLVNTNRLIRFYDGATGLKPARPTLPDTAYAQLPPAMACRLFRSSWGVKAAMRALRNPSSCWTTALRALLYTSRSCRRTSCIR